MVPIFGLNKLFSWTTQGQNKIEANFSGLVVSPGKDGSTSWVIIFTFFSLSQHAHPLFIRYGEVGYWDIACVQQKKHPKMIILKNG